MTEKPTPPTSANVADSTVLDAGLDPGSADDASLAVALEAVRSALEQTLPAADMPVMVLLVDDQAIVAEAVRRALASEREIDFHYCAHPDEAVRTAEEVRPTVILQDLVMPGTDGLTLVRGYRANEATRDVPIIVLSTKEEPAIKSAAFASGANDYLVKLPDSVELIARVKYHSRSYVNMLQRDEAYRALRRSQQELLRANLELRRLTHSDGLTGLSNRRYLDEFLSAEWKRAERERTEISLLMIDVDYFKPYNDTYGHVAGDNVLRSVATTIRREIRQPRDLVARFGGEEFAVVLPGTGSAGARLLAEKMRRDVAGLALPHVGSAVSEHLTISIGVATLTPAPGLAETALIEEADAALYRAKRDGRNRVAFSTGVSGRA
ncbi:two-component system chemotaxis family response regulator WspR [Paraburkholderia silvatlantica]|uniref:diguanylate cyclase n=2 Tax=Paraburkholderia silvatlantica TaxID=321895 RepID=A0A2U1A7Y3_9BURK|nr:two-component system chemotaxis family response regulator WspR [Paraburkholderia silvatlantica]PVY28704.1 response regulator receiver modulated diguanylate cyclase [Paraburkholderia silvatlantica]PXW36341.1 response regulator receiver modulated diguanylate cyclase [Paraburkholderia silvatlantica]PYE21665.1 response regulator receiver modulated diguanylate cyclase [Paraburkholderia silvatlantica]TDQ86788.1 response regulator receiver modulated diguanylate cyclase [Paraburkholderia silvatlanti